MLCSERLLRYLIVKQMKVMPLIIRSQKLNTDPLQWSADDRARALRVLGFVRFYQFNPIVKGNFG